ncbi:MAG TPA: Gfo/Idh/MocA family oxidoreductase [Candidatus Paceibacterota bacterium]|nr:Gfo/Idh/MocA family oxidoreductase [Verrucomicrobiota bacterium]HSA10833.1 Gfo/Idh/MocA family oxidoreductase [Candidatus Paceibacterota bacterium]
MKASETSNQIGTPGVSRRKFIAASGAAAAAFTIVPRHVLGGTGFVAPSEKITVAYIGCGTQGLREMPGMLAMPEVQIVAVCDPVKESHDYVDWSKDGLRTELAAALGRPDWRRGTPGIPGGRDIAKEVVETYYAAKRGSEKFTGCAAYADFRELLEKEKDVNAVKVMTPDHLHATIAIAAMKQGKHVMMHKPLANRLLEARWVIETARQTKVATHFLAASDGANAREIKNWVDAGAIGKLREIHNWSNRPVWPQYATIPTDQPPVPAGFDWPLWLGPSLDRPYHPHYTHAVFRGWYEFGGGALADMGHYSLWPVFQVFDLDAPVMVESRPSHVCALKDSVSVRIRNDYSFPAACTIRFKFAAKGSRPALDLFWYDGSMRPPSPEELEAENTELPAEGMMFVGDNGKILAGFRGEDPHIIPGKKMREFQAAEKARQGHPGQARREAAASWVAACKGGPPSYGDFLRAGSISAAFNLGAVSLRLGGRRLLFDAPRCKVPNVAEADRCLGREYRAGWELTGPKA